MPSSIRPKTRPSRSPEQALCQARRCPRLIELAGHNHMSEVFASIERPVLTGRSRSSCGTRNKIETSTSRVSLPLRPQLRSIFQTLLISRSRRPRAVSAPWRAGRMRRQGGNAVLAKTSFIFANPAAPEAERRRFRGTSSEPAGNQDQNMLARLVADVLNTCGTPRGRNRSYRRRTISSDPWRKR